MKEIVRYILETVVCSGILYGAYLLFLRNRTGYLAARLCLTGSLLAAALIPLLRIPVWPGKVIYATAGTPAETTFTAPSVSAAAFDYEAAIWIVYGCGVLLLLSSMFRQALLIRRLRRHSTQERIGRIVLVRPTAQSHRSPSSARFISAAPSQKKTLRRSSPTKRVTSSTAIRSNGSLWRA